MAPIGSSPIIFAVAAFVLMGVSLLGIELATLGRYYEANAGGGLWPWKGLIGVMLLIVSAPPALICLFLFWGTTYKHLQWSQGTRGLVLGASSVGCLIISILSLTLLVQPWLRLDDSDAFGAFEGVFLMCLFVPLTVVLALLARRSMQPPEFSQNSGRRSVSSSSKHASATHVQRGSSSSHGANRSSNLSVNASSSHSPRLVGIATHVHVSSSSSSSSSSGRGSAGAGAGDNIATPLLLDTDGGQSESSQLHASGVDEHEHDEHEAHPHDDDDDDDRISPATAARRSTTASRPPAPRRTHARPPSAKGSASKTWGHHTHTDASNADASNAHAQGSLDIDDPLTRSNSKATSPQHGQHAQSQSQSQSLGSTSLSRNSNSNSNGNGKREKDMPTMVAMPTSKGKGKGAGVEAELGGFVGEDVDSLLAQDTVYEAAQRARVFRDHLLVVLMYFGIVPFIIFLVMALPPHWNIAFGPFALQNNTGYAVSYSPVATDNIEVSDYLVLKLFPDHVAFYSFVYFVFVLSALSRIPAFNRAFVQTRLPLCGCCGARARSDSASDRSQPHTGTELSYWQTLFVTPSEILIVGNFLALCGWWLWFWYANYNQETSPRISGLPQFERLARTMGEFSSLIMAFLVLPVTRNSLWERLMGISFERAIKYHRWLGIMFALSLTLHVSFWYVRWVQIDTFWHDIFNVQPYIVADDETGHFDNFLMPMLLITYVLVLVLVVCAYYTIRRKWFELFYYTHMLAYVILAAALIHAWALWTYLIGGLLLYYVDRLVRLAKGCSEVELVDMGVTDDEQHTRLELRVQGLHYQPGQYCFFNIPEISVLQWHPFSICSAPHDEHLTFLIKNMGPRSWTAELYQRAMFPDKSTTMLINIDGAYGRFSTMHHSHYDALVLVAGGVGITPMHSLYRHLYHLKQINSNSAAIQTSIRPSVVYLYWIVREAESLTALTDSFNLIMTQNPGNMFRLKLYATRAPMSESTQKLLGACAAHYRYGRPDFAPTFAQLRVEHQGERVAVLACGPQPLIDSVSHIAHHHHFDFHEETFEL